MLLHLRYSKGMGTHRSSALHLFISFALLIDIWDLIIISRSFYFLKICDAGHYCPTPTEAPSVCEAGTYAQSGSTSCRTCPEGSYAENNGSTFCTECETGHFCSVTKSSLCSAGTFSDTKGKQPSPVSDVLFLWEVFVFFCWLINNFKT